MLSGSTRPVSEWLVEPGGPEPGRSSSSSAAGTGETGFLGAVARLRRTADHAPRRARDAGGGCPRLAARARVTDAQFRVLDAERSTSRTRRANGVPAASATPPSRLASRRRASCGGSPRPGGRLAFAVSAPRARNAWITIPPGGMVERRHVALNGGPSRLSARRNRFDRRAPRARRGSPSRDRGVTSASASPTPTSSRSSSVSCAAGRARAQGSTRRSASRCARRSGPGHRTPTGLETAASA